MKAQKTINIRLKNTVAFRRWQKLSAAKTAFERKLEQLRGEAGLPTSKQFKRDCKGLLVDGNGQPVAKYTVFSKPGFEMPPCKVCRIS
jgi:hypothetical protein